MNEYPLLKVDFNGDGDPTWEEFGMQPISDDALAVALASNALMIAYTSPDTNSNSVTTNVMLATNIGHGVSITWGSSNTNVIAINGEVTRPIGEINATVTLTATLNKGTESATKIFTLTVLAIQPHPNDRNTNLIDITTLDQLNAMRYDLDGNGVADNLSDTAAYTSAFTGLATNQIYRGYELMTNLDFAGSVWASNQSNVEGWDPIGTYAAIFEGNGNVISGLYINRATDYIGLFGGVTTTNAELRNLGLSNLWVRGSSAVGGLVGENDGGRITASYAMGTVTGSGEVGGLVGIDNGGRITASYVMGTVTSSGEVGGLVGWNDGGRITASYATGTVTGSPGSLSVGGLVGYSDNSTITASYAIGTVTGPSSSFVGGLVGEDYGTITNSYFDRNRVGPQAASSSQRYRPTPPWNCKLLRATRVSIAIGTSMSTTAFCEAIQIWITPGTLATQASIPYSRWILTAMAWPHGRSLACKMLSPMPKRWS